MTTIAAAKTRVQETRARMQKSLATMREARAARAALRREAAEEQKREKDYAWYLEKVHEAKADYAGMPLQPAQAHLRRRAVVRQQQLWDEVSGRKPRSTWRALVRNGLRPDGGLKEGFIRMFLVERNNFVRPEVPTGLVEFWAPKAARADDTRVWKGAGGVSVLTDPTVYCWLALPRGTVIEDVLTPSMLDGLVTDDHHIDDIVATERRAANRRVQSAGYLAGKVNKPPDETSLWEQYFLHIIGVAFALLGLITRAVAG